MPPRKKGGKGGKGKGKSGGPPKKKKGGGHHTDSKHPPSGASSTGSSTQSRGTSAVKAPTAASIALRKQRNSIIDQRYSGLTGAAHMSSFFGIFTKHNKKIYQVLTKNYLSELIYKQNALDAPKFTKTLESFNNRDLNQYIYHGDNVVGCVVCELRTRDKTLFIRGLVILPHFRNFGFGSRLMVNLLKAVDTRTNIDRVNTTVPNDCDARVLSFFDKFGLSRLKAEEESKSEGGGGDDDATNPSALPSDRITLSLNVKSMKESIGAEVIESMKAAKQSSD